LRAGPSLLASRITDRKCKFYIYVPQEFYIWRRFSSLQVWVEGFFFCSATWVPAINSLVFMIVWMYFFFFFFFFLKKKKKKEKYIFMVSKY
jgi:hypothetical protein